MAYAQQPNVIITVADGWKLVSDGGPNVLIQLLSVTGVILAIGPAAPAANSGDGFSISPRSGRDTFAMSGLTTEKIYGRVLSGVTAVLAVAKG